MKTLPTNIAGLFSVGLGLTAATTAFGGNNTTTDWTSSLVAPVANPIFFESPAIGNEVRPLFMYHQMNDKFLGVSTDVEVYALQFRLKLTDRLALIATKDGYVTIHPKGGGTLEGWADIGGGLKYTLVNDEQNKFLLTPGVKFELPSGDAEVFQNNGSGEFDIFVSAAKEFNNLQVMGSLGARLPLDTDEESSQLHYSLQLTYPVCQWFKPFVAANGFLGLSDGNGPAINSEGYDLINFGASNVSGENMLVLGAGFRSSVCEKADFGFAFEKAVDHAGGIFDYRITADLIWKF